MKTYNQYKDSEIEWVDGIPIHWESKRLKVLFDESLEQNWDKNCTFYLSVLKDIGVIPYTEKGNIGNKTSEDTSNYRLVKKGDIVVNTTNVCIGSVGLSRFDGCLSSVMYIILRPRKNTLPEYYDWIFKLRMFQKHLRKISNGILEVREYMNKTLFFIEKLPFPPLLEQLQIVEFLNQKTTIIKDLIQKKQRKIELLKEYRTSIINQTVVNGLNPNVEMKESGVEWIGKIPVDWDSIRMKYLCEMITEKGKTSEMDIKISPENMESHTGRCFNLYSEYTGEGMKFQKGDILFNKLRVYLVKILFTDFDGFSMGEMIVLRPRRIDNQYLFYTLFNQGLIDLLNSQSTGIKLPRVSPDIILNSYLPSPPIQEQQEIVHFLNKKTSEIDTQITFENNKIELLKEFYQSLISEVVTGKIDVRQN